LRARTGVCWDAGEHEQWGRALVGSGAVPDPELVERPRRRRFSAQYKLEILREADACTRPGEIGELLRREGLYSSLLTEWRRARDSGALQALERPRGRRKADPSDGEISRLRRRAERAERELEKARKVIEVQGRDRPRAWPQPAQRPRSRDRAPVPRARCAPH